ncbi:uridine kinase [Paenibacillus sp. CCS19]|uniref:kinase n=1 Tax=Paenibacillus sp. CCS19 TaxID=3158387 RepID=UPI0025600DC0|nr:kinase [Paenibacillus cellulosilyticus]GMK41510.1 uridine kinase [Paenibacillus cellulosilyticus]
MYDLDEVTEIIMNQCKKDRFILGIDGLSRAGKTTLVNDLQQKLIARQKPVCIFHIDDHIVERNKRYDTGFEQWYEYYYLQWDVAFIQQQFLSKLSHAQEISIPYYNSELDKVEMKTVTMNSNCIIIIEGVFLQRSPWREYFDFIIYLECAREKRFDRETASSKHNLDKFKLRYWKAEDYYLNTVQPRTHADMVIFS